MGRAPGSAAVAAATVGASQPGSAPDATERSIPAAPAVDSGAADGSRGAADAAGERPVAA